MQDKDNQNEFERWGDYLLESDRRRKQLKSANETRMYNVVEAQKKMELHLERIDKNKGANKKQFSRR
jgi:hypothetical protein